MESQKTPSHLVKAILKRDKDEGLKHLGFKTNYIAIGIITVLEHKDNPME